MLFTKGKQMQPIRLIYQNAPSMINIPKQFNGHAIEVIIWPLDKSEVKQSVETDANGWPIGFFDETVGAWAGEPLER